MKFLEAIQLLELFFLNPIQLLKILQNKEETAKEIFYNIHLPFLIHFPIIVLISPYFWYSFFLKNTSIKSILWIYFFIPLGIYSILILFSVFFDKLQIYSQTPTINLPRKYFCLYSSLFTTASLLFFIFHPILGYFTLLFSFIYSYAIGIYFWSQFLKKEVKKLILETILSISFFLLILVILLFLLNLLNSYYDLKKFGIL